MRRCFVEKWTLIGYFSVLGLSFVIMYAQCWGLRQQLDRANQTTNLAMDLLTQAYSRHDQVIKSTEILTEEIQNLRITLALLQTPQTLRLMELERSMELLRKMQESGE